MQTESKLKWTTNKIKNERNGNGNANRIEITDIERDITGNGKYLGGDEVC